MSAKLTIVLFILICFEIGALLVVLPWLSQPSWSENYLLYIAVEKVGWRWLAPFLTSGYVRGAVSGLGLLNIMLGAWEIANFKKTVRTFQIEWQGRELDQEILDTGGVHDHQPASASTPK
jgi:hypothetical protein